MVFIYAHLCIYVTIKKSHQFLGLGRHGNVGEKGKRNW